MRHETQQSARGRVGGAAPRAQINGIWRGAAAALLAAGVNRIRGTSLKQTRLNQL